MPAGSAFPPASRLGAAVVGAVALASVALQYALILQATRDDIGPVLGTVRFLSYFTILSNIAVVLATGYAALRLTGFFGRPGVRGAVTLYIGVTGIVYTAILRHLWQPQGAQWWADAGLHYVSPLLYVLWWLWLAPHGALAWRGILGWLVFPAVYVAWAFVRGEWVKEYPYPFLDVGQLGWPKVVANSTGVLALFVVAGLVLVALDRWLGRRARHPG